MLELVNHKDINRRDYVVHVYYLQEVLSATLMEGRRLNNELNKMAQHFGLKVDFTKAGDVIRFVNDHVLLGKRSRIKDISNSVLINLYDETGCGFFTTLLAYRKCAERYRRTASFIKTVVDDRFNLQDRESVKRFLNQEREPVYIYPTFTINRTGLISMSSPHVPFDTEGIKRLFGFNIAITTDGSRGENATVELLDVMDKYSHIIWGVGDDYCYLVLGNTLYLNMMTDVFNTFYDGSSYNKAQELIEEFQREYGQDAEEKLGAVSKKNEGVMEWDESKTFSLI